ncbi:coiled-coil domain-containing protein [Deferrisoma sp.]
MSGAGVSPGELAGRLSRAAGRVADTARASEERFVAYLGRVQTLLECCLDAAARAEETAGRLGGVGLEAVADDLRRGMEALAGWDGGSHAGRALDRLVDPLAHVPAAAEEAKRAVRYLRALAVSTRIEVARFGAARSDLMVLPEVVARLSVRIGELFDSVLSRSRRLEDAVRARRDELRRLEARGVEDLRAAVERMREALDASVAAASRARAAAEGMGRAAQAAGAAAGRILTALQSQDITRQRLEQVGLALGEAAGYAGDPAQAGRVAAQAEIASVLALEIAQMDEALDAYAAALEAVGREFDEIAEAAAGLRTSLEGLQAGSGGDAVGGGGDLTAHLEALRASRDEVAGILRQAASEAEALTGQVDTIEDVVSDLDLIALNAIIQAARAGREGRTLAVIATEIQREAAKAGGVGRGVAHALRRLGEASASLRQSQDGDDGLEGFAGLPQRLEGAARALEAIRREAETELGACLGRLDETLAEARRDSPAAWVRDEVASARREMASLLETLRAAVPPGVAGPGDLVDRVQRDYTMATQRRVHEEVVGGAADEEAGEFGDNVELF